MIAYDVSGTSGGPALVLLHGVGLDRSMWDRCLPALERDHRVVRIDLRGHGGSAPAAPGTTLSELTGDVSEVLDEVGVSTVHLVGFSLGALVAQRLSVDQPQRVSSLTLVSSVAVRTPDERAAVSARLRAAEADFPATVEAAVSRWFDDDWVAREPDLVASVRRTLLSNDRSSYLACYRVFATADAEIAPLLGSIQAPTLVITGSDDPGSTPDMTFRLERTIPNARAEIVAGARHLLPVERADEFANALCKHIERTQS